LKVAKVKFKLIYFIIMSLIAGGISSVYAAGSEFRPIPLQSSITSVQPMTGIVMWQDSRNSHTDAIQLEYSYMRYSDVVTKKGIYDWSVVERKLDAVAARKHQAILRFWDTYPGHPTGIPAYIKALPDYREITAKSENRDTGFPDWSHPEYQRFVREFYQTFARQYDRDPRLAFLETGFGLWAEYHVYSGPEEPGKTFPSKAFQAKFFPHMANVFKETPWMISQDAHVAKRTPFASQPALLELRFGIFDDSFHLAWEPGYNLDGWTFFGRDRYRHSPAGGEILFPNQQRETYVAKHWAAETRNFGITFMICEQWPRLTTMERIKEHGLACGYKFKVLAFKASPDESQVTVTNTGVAPIYYDAFVTVNDVRAEASLRYLQPDETRQFTIASGGTDPRLTIECDRLVKGQQITFDADLK
jgi:hypothetical protein